MPQLTFRGVQPATVGEASSLLAPRLAALMNCPEDYFTFDCITTVSFASGKRVETYPFVELLWFDRGRSVRDQAARILHEVLAGLGVPDSELCFKNASPAEYYGNGVSYEHA